MRAINYVPLLALVGLLASCSSSAQSVDLGNDKAPNAAEPLANYEGTWDGYVEAYQFPSGSDRLRIVLDASGQGSVEFGDIPPIPPFSDPTKGYPESDVFEWNDYYRPREGFAYPVHELDVTDSHIKLVVWGTDVVRAFCAAQTDIYPDAGLGGYTCSPTGGGHSEDAMGNCYHSEYGSSKFGMQADCGWIEACVHGCTCDATSCTSTRSPGAELAFDGSLVMDGAQLVGTLVLHVSGAERATVRLTKR